MASDTPIALCATCNGRRRISCPGPSKTNAERKHGRETVDWCYGMHMGHECPDCHNGSSVGGAE